MVKYLETKADFDQALTEAGDKLVVVDFTASWCGPCQTIAPVFEACKTDYPDVMFFKVDVDKNGETAESQSISAMPTFIFYRKGKKVDLIRGASEAKLKEKIESLK